MIHALKLLRIAAIAALLLTTAFAGASPTSPTTEAAGITMLTPTMTSFPMTSGQFHTFMMSLSKELGMDAHLLSARFIMAHTDMALQKELKAALMAGHDITFDRRLMAKGIHGLMADKALGVEAKDCKKVEGAINHGLVAAGFEFDVNADLKIEKAAKVERKLDANRDVELEDGIQADRDINAEFKVEKAAKVERNLDVDVNAEHGVLGTTVSPFAVQRDINADLKVEKAAKIERKLDANREVELEDGIQADRDINAEFKVEKAAKVERNLDAKVDAEHGVLGTTVSPLGVMRDVDASAMIEREIKIERKVDVNHDAKVEADIEKVAEVDKEGNIEADVKMVENKLEVNSGKLIDNSGTGNIEADVMMVENKVDVNSGKLIDNSGTGNLIDNSGKQIEAEELEVEDEDEEELEEVEEDEIEEDDEAEVELKIEKIKD
jgi:hypothetical protein